MESCEPREATSSASSSLNKENVPKEKSLYAEKKKIRSNSNEDFSFDGCKDVYANDALVVHSAKRKLSGKKQLENFYMRVKKNSIYCLIGPSGCGKTTLISCIVGLKKLDSGCINLFNKESSGIQGPDVGFMPQEIALWDQFTIGETLAYMGRLNKMNSEKIEKETRFFIKLFQLPPENRSILGLSGGEKRRVSLAVTLQHLPKFIILDEPTVGVDCLLRETIWEYLTKLTHQKCTILMITHHMSEAKRADIVGIMRNGRMLKQDVPIKLTAEFKTNLDGVIMALSNEDDKNISNKQEANDNEGKNKFEKFTKNISLRNFKIFELDHMSALIKKNFIHLISDPFYLFFLGIMPTLQLILFCIAIGGEFKALRIAYFSNETFGSCSSELHVDPCQNQILSCYYLEILNEHTSITTYQLDDVDQAYREVILGRSWGILHFQPNFSKNIFNSINNEFKTDLLENSIITNLDMSNQQIAHAIKTQMVEAYEKLISQVYKCHNVTKISALPFKFGPQIFGDEKPNYQHYIAPGALLTTIFFMGVSLTAQILISEKKGGMLERSYVAGMRHSELIISHCLTQNIVLLFQLSLVFIYLYCYLQIHLIHSSLLPWIIFLAWLQGNVGIFIGFAMTSFLKNEGQVHQISLMIFMFNFLLSGVIWPLESLPDWLRALAALIPQSAIDAFRSLIIRGWDISHPKVKIGFISSAIWIGVLILIMFVERFGSKHLWNEDTTMITFLKYKFINRNKMKISNQLNVKFDNSSSGNSNQDSLLKNEYSSSERMNSPVLSVYLPESEERESFICRFLTSPSSFYIRFIQRVQDSNQN